MFYANSFTSNLNLDNYTAKLSHPSLGEFYGLINNETFDWDFKTGITSGDSGGLFDKVQDGLSSLGSGAGAIANDVPGVIGKALKIFSVGASAVSAGMKAGNDLHKAITGKTVGESLESSTLRRVNSEYGNLAIAVTCTFFKGMQLRGQTCPSFKQFMNKVRKIHLPETKTAGYMRTPQINFDIYLDIFKSQATLKSEDDLKPLREQLWEVKIGRLFQLKGWWMTDTKVSQTNHFDENGQPLIWTATFSFEYFKQMTQSELDNPFR